MKEAIISIAVFAVLLLLTPLVLAGHTKNVNKIRIHNSVVSAYKTDVSTFRVYNLSTKNTEQIAAFPFICGVVAGEMPAEYHPEALKAQAVAAFSYCCYLRTQRLDKVGAPLPQNADFTIGSNKFVAYISKEQSKAKFGSNYDSYWSKIEAAVRAVYGKALTYNGSICNAVYCDMSSGTTESCKDVWGDDVPYLVEVPSPGDKLCKGYETHVDIAENKFCSEVLKFYKGAVFPSDHLQWISGINRSAAGGVISANLCGKKVRGVDIRSLFGLRSTDFSVSYADGRFTFDVKGYGHGVGLSQEGAESMASEGKSWEDILKWYYKGAQITDYDWPSL